LISAQQNLEFDFSIPDTLRLSYWQRIQCEFSAAGIVLPHFQCLLKRTRVLAPLQSYELSCVVMVSAFTLVLLLSGWIILNLVPV